jgi:hypothetical protein
MNAVSFSFGLDLFHSDCGAFGATANRERMMRLEGLSADGTD